MSNRIIQLQELIKDANNLHINSEWLAHVGVIEYFPEELVITIKAGTKISDIQMKLAKHNQTLPFFIKIADMSIGAAYAQGAQDLSDCVLGVKIIDGTGEYLNFGGQVMKNVAGYDVARLLVGSKGKLALITQISFKVIPISYITQLSASIKRTTTSQLRQQIERKLKQVFDPRGIFH
ncbi:FAD/FMN-containing dehydrogenases-like protein [Candidatus Ruthia magnifica str. Cm (Calyptogena magnifica)]|uniref:FAD/FMN-containing dehydrogenases-like protein n=1 Tax=Ruthia magnifica subsp. Calyptogena magnifica TaxID=413404 RepID=A1AVY5_RUTMC|nr:FAD-binding protein [Candidatus Ruthturnera calyptogenae]ABL02092.1 FAD/FMN-containing dehydrogenases-like protein [Candidatus Ruthia magnifica str. Cm (Calyptogena magnifica)]